MRMKQRKWYYIDYSYYSYYTFSVSFLLDQDRHHLFLQSFSFYPMLPSHSVYDKHENFMLILELRNNGKTHKFTLRDKGKDGFRFEFSSVRVRVGTRVIFNGVIVATATFLCLLLVLCVCWSYFFSDFLFVITITLTIARCIIRL